jgi:hypothetical protein
MQIKEFCSNAADPTTKYKLQTKTEYNTGDSVADPDPYNFLESGRILMSTTKLTGRENLTKYAFWLVQANILRRKIKLRCIKKKPF